MLLGGRNGIRPVKIEWLGTGMVIGLKRGVNDLHNYDPADATAALSSLALLKSRMVLPFWCWLTQVVLLNGCSVAVVVSYQQ